MKDVSNKELMKLHDSNIVAGWSIQSFNAAIKTRELILSKLTAGEAAVKKVAELEKEVERLEGRHCADCCCDKSWKALGITEYTGKSIPEHIAELRQQAASGQRAVEAMDKIIKCMDNNWLDGMVVIIQEYKEPL